MGLHGAIFKRTSDSEVDGGKCFDHAERNSFEAKRSKEKRSETVLKQREAKRREVKGKRSKRMNDDALELFKRTFPGAGSFRQVEFTSQVIFLALARRLDSAKCTKLIQDFDKVMTEAELTEKDAKK